MPSRVPAAVWPAACLTSRWVGSSSPSSPTHHGWPAWGSNASAGSLPRGTIVVTRKVAQRFVTAANAALPIDGAATARELLASDLELLERLEAQADQAEQRIAELLTATPYGVLTTTPGWATVRAGRYGAALGEPSRWPTARQVYRASGLTPKTYESPGTRYDGQICREGSVELRGALLELGLGLWLNEPGGRTYATSLKARGKPAGIIACAMACRANKIAFAMVRDQTPYQPSRWKD